MNRLLPVQSRLLSGVAGLRHGFFTRVGGVSKGLYESLNVGHATRDPVACVDENRARVETFLGLDPGQLKQCDQVHSAIALHTADMPTGSMPSGDGVVASGRKIGAGVLTADCAPLLIVDPQAGVVAAVHAGWRGAIGGIVEAGIDLMVAHGAVPARMIAAVGPCISLKSYEVGEGFDEPFLEQDPDNAVYFQRHEQTSRLHFDLPGYVLSRLALKGVSQSEWTGQDTCEQETLFFSNRRAVHRKEADFGRQISALALV